MHRITLRKMHRRHRARREQAMVEKLVEVAQIPVVLARAFLAEEHQITPTITEQDDSVGLMQVLNPPVNHLAAAADPRWDCKDLAVAYVSPPVAGMRYLSSDEIERLSKMHIVLAPETQVLVDVAWAQALTEPAPKTPRNTEPASNAKASEPTVAHGSEHGSEAAPVEIVIPAAEITKAEIEDGAEEDDLDDEDPDEDDEDDMNMSDHAECDEDEDADEMTEEQLDAIERASDPSPVMTSPVAEAVLRAAMLKTALTKSATPAPEPAVAVVYPPAPAGATCATCQEPAVHHVGYHDYCKRCTPTSLKRKAKKDRS